MKYLGRKWNYISPYTTEKLNTQYSFETELVIVREGKKFKEFSRLPLLYERML